MSWLAALLAINAVVHGIVVARYGIRHHNEPFFVFALVDAALAIAVFRAVPYALWAVLILSLIGLIGLSITFGVTPIQWTGVRESRCLVYADR